MHCTAEELSPRVRFRFISFLHALLAGHGTRAAQHLLSWSDKQVRMHACMHGCMHACMHVGLPMGSDYCDTHTC